MLVQVHSLPLNFKTLPFLPFVLSLFYLCMCIPYVSLTYFSIPIILDLANICDCSGDILLILSLITFLHHQF